MYVTFGRVCVRGICALCDIKKKNEKPSNQQPTNNQPTAKKRSAAQCSHTTVRAPTRRTTQRPATPNRSVSVVRVCWLCVCVVCFVVAASVLPSLAATIFLCLVHSFFWHTRELITMTPYDVINFFHASYAINWLVARSLSFLVSSPDGPPVPMHVRHRITILPW